MKTIFNIAVLAFLLVAAPSLCFALRDITPLTKEEAKGASFYFGVPITELPAKPAEIARLVRTDLQHALDGAVAAY